jgi:phosphoribosylglycinamide formyltransferase-1
MSGRIGVLISGRGSNLLALIRATQEGRLDATITIVISNVADAPGLAHARSAGIEALVVSHQGWQSRADFDRALAAELTRRGVSLVCLAGFMRRVGEPLIEAFPNAILNIHPSLLPAFSGLDPQRQAIEHGAKMSGATVHLVTPDLDGGPIVLQRPVPVVDGDTPITLAERILEEEHRLYPEAVQLVIGGRWHLDGRRFIAAVG